MTEPVEPRASLILCEYAKAVNGELSMAGGGLRAMPTGTPWFIAGTVDVPLDQVQHGISVTLWDHSEDQEVSGEPIHLPIEIEVLPEGDAAVLRLMIALPLPIVELPPERLCSWQFSIGSVRQQLPFMSSIPGL